MPITNLDLGPLSSTTSELSTIRNGTEHFLSAIGWSPSSAGITFRSSSLLSFCWSISLTSWTNLRRIETQFCPASARKPKKWTRRSFHGRSLSTACIPRRRSFRRSCNMPSEPFLHERDDFKALVETVADGEKINDPALVEK